MKRTNRDQIDELYVWVVEQSNGTEMIATPTILRDAYPLVTTSKELAQLRMTKLAEGAARETGCTTKLVKFVRAEVLE
jgi:hypothetical protein